MRVIKVMIRIMLSRFTICAQIVQTIFTNLLHIKYETGVTSKTGKDQCVNK